MVGLVDLICCNLCFVCGTSIKLVVFVGFAALVILTQMPQALQMQQVPHTQQVPQMLQALQMQQVPRTQQFVPSVQLVVIVPFVQLIMFVPFVQLVVIVPFVPFVVFLLVRMLALVVFVALVVTSFLLIRLIATLCLPTKHISTTLTTPTINIFPNLGNTDLL